MDDYSLFNMVHSSNDHLRRINDHYDEQRRKREAQAPETESQGPKPPQGGFKPEPWGFTQLKQPSGERMNIPRLGATSLGNRAPIDRFIDWILGIQNR